jgi:para-nitrobenzyl esterase
MPAFYSDNLIVDGHVVPEDVVQAFAAGRQAPVPMIIGTNSAEFWWIRPSDAGAYGRLDDALLDSEHQALIEAYEGPAGYDSSIVSDLVFNEPARHLARLHVRAGGPTWHYRFDVVAASNPEPSGGATHASERPYVFDNLRTVGRPMQARDQMAADLMAGYWAGFAITGAPVSATGVQWPQAVGDQLLEFTNEGPRVVDVPNQPRLDLIEAYYSRVRPGR